MSSTSTSHQAQPPPSSTQCATASTSPIRHVPAAMSAGFRFLVTLGMPVQRETRACNVYQEHSLWQAQQHARLVLETRLHRQPARQVPPASATLASPVQTAARAPSVVLQRSGSGAPTHVKLVLLDPSRPRAVRRPEPVQHVPPGNTPRDRRAKTARLVPLLPQAARRWRHVQLAALGHTLSQARHASRARLTRLRRPAARRSPPVSPTAATTGPTAARSRRAGRTRSPSARAARLCPRACAGSASRTTP